EISWDKMESEFEKLFSENGRPSIAIRKIAGMFLLKEMFKESDETVVERWIENAYWQYFNVNSEKNMRCLISKINILELNKYSRLIIKSLILAI
ncbi:transposase, partial [Chryseobacterium sp. HMWF001]